MTTLQRVAVIDKKTNVVISITEIGGKVPETCVEAPHEDHYWIVLTDDTKCECGYLYQSGVFTPASE